MDCKKALEEADGDFDKAVEIMRTKGQARTAKRGAERDATAGLVAASGGALVEPQVGDRLRRQERGVHLHRAGDRRRRRRRQGDDTEAAKAVPLGERPSGETVEKLAIDHRREDRAPPGGLLRGSDHGLPAQACGRPAPGRGVLVEYEGDETAAQQALTQVAAPKPRPQHVTRSRPTSWRRRRTSSPRRRSRRASPRQPSPRSSRAVSTRFYKDVVLLEQESVTEAKKTVKAVLDAAGTTVSGSLVSRSVPEEPISRSWGGSAESQ